MRRPDSASSPTQPYSWSSASWFGPLFGCTVWMFVLAIMAWSHDATAGAAVLIAYLVANVLGILLWSRRAVIRPQVAIQIQLGVTLLLALGSVAVVDWRVDLASVEAGFSARQIYGTLIVYPLLMLVFRMRDRAAQRGS